MTTFNLDKVLRRLKPEKHLAPFKHRDDSALSFVEDEAIVGPPLLLDTNVYINVLKGKTPAKVDDLLGARTLYHSAVAIAELAISFGKRLPANPAEMNAREILAQSLRQIPPHRTVAPTTAIWGEAGILAGLRARVGGIQLAADQLNDALIFLQASTLGAVVLTENLADFDIFQQIAPSGRVLFYRTI